MLKMSENRIHTTLRLIKFAQCDLLFSFGQTDFLKKESISLTDDIKFFTLNFLPMDTLLERNENEILDLELCTNWSKATTEKRSKVGQPIRNLMQLYNIDKETAIQSYYDWRASL